MESATVPRPRINPRGILITIILILLAALAVLLYLYLRLVLPPSTANKPNMPGITHIFSIYGSGNDKLKQPHGVAVDKAGNIYIADTGKARIMVFDPSGQRLIRKIIVGSDKKARSEKILQQVERKRREELRKKGVKIKSNEIVIPHISVDYRPYSIDIDDDGNIFVACASANLIFIYNSKWEKVREIKIKAPLNAIVEGNRLYALSKETIYMLTLKGALISKWGRKGREPGNIDRPMALVLDRKGNKYISDSLNLRLQAFNSQDDLMWVLGKPIKKMNEAKRFFGFPAGIALGTDGNLYLVDSFHGTVFVIDKKGRKLAELGQYGAADGQLQMPTLITHVRDNLFLIADKFNDRVQMLAITPPGK